MLFFLIFSLAFGASSQRIAQQGRHLQELKQGCQAAESFSDFWLIPGKTPAERLLVTAGRIYRLRNVRDHDGQVIIAVPPEISHHSRWLRLSFDNNGRLGHRQVLSEAPTSQEHQEFFQKWERANHLQSVLWGNGIVPDSEERDRVGTFLLTHLNPKPEIPADVESLKSATQEYDALIEEVLLLQMQYHELTEQCAPKGKLPCESVVQVFEAAEFSHSHQALNVAHWKEFYQAQTQGHQRNGTYQEPGFCQQNDDLSKQQDLTSELSNN